MHDLLLIAVWCHLSWLAHADSDHSWLPWCDSDLLPTVQGAACSTTRFGQSHASWHVLSSNAMAAACTSSMSPRLHVLLGPTTLQCDTFDSLPCWHLQVVTTSINYAGTPVTEVYVLNQCSTAQPVSSQGPPGAKQFQIPLTAVDVVVPFVQAYLVRVQRCCRTPVQSLRASARQPLDSWA